MQGTISFSLLLFAINNAYSLINIISNITMIFNISNPWTNVVPHVRSTGNLSSTDNTYNTSQRVLNLVLIVISGVEMASFR